MGHIHNLLKDQSDKVATIISSMKPVGSTLPPVIKPLWKCLACEFIGTFLLIFIGCGVGLRFSEKDEEKPMVHVALCWGFLIATLGQTLHYSCDINPAVTLAKLATRKTRILDAVLYIIVQCVGCTAGAYVLKLLTPDYIIGDFGITRLAADVSPGKGCVIEGICTFLLLLTVFSASDEGRDDLKGSVPLSIGLCVTSLIMTAAYYTAASFNPARTLGPSIVVGNFEHHWVYWVGPIVGGLIGGLTYEHVFRVRRVSQEEVIPPPSPV